MLRSDEGHGRQSTAPSLVAAVATSRLGFADTTTTPPAGQPIAQARDPQDPGAAGAIRSRRDLEQFERIFADAAFWKKLGEEYEAPLIITGTILFVEGTTRIKLQMLDPVGNRTRCGHLPEDANRQLDGRDYILGD